MSAAVTPWIVRPAPNPSAKLRLVCFPHAGGGARFFRDWPRLLPKEVEVLALQPPGREERLGDPPFTHFEPLLNAAVDALMPHLVPPYAFFGHSMGALLAFEAARRLQRRGGALPVHLLVSGMAAPTRPRTTQPLHRLSDADLRAHLRVYQGTPEAVLRSEELMRVLLPMLRADFAVRETYRFEAREPLPFPVSAFGGDADLSATPEDLEAWRGQTSSTFASRVFAGNHFYLKDCPEFFAALSELLTNNLRQASSGSDWLSPSDDISLAPEEVHVWRASLNLPAELLLRLSESLNPEERARANAFYFDTDRVRFQAAHGILRSVLGRYLSMPPAAVSLVTGTNGKPELAASMGMPLRFNLSHSGALALIALTRSDDVGIDVEKLRPVPTCLQIAESYFAPAERETLRRLDSSLRDEAFLRCWTRKEAFLKARGDGLSFGLDRFAVAFAPGEPARLLWIDGDPHVARDWWMSELPTGPGYVAACAVRKACNDLRLWEWTCR